eukprot:XP_011663228.1 PREDICTED: uncharacterized protein LOC593995 [Strongylocentrotus purpuratus]
MVKGLTSGTKAAIAGSQTERVVELGRGKSLIVKTPQYIFAYRSAYFGDVEGFYTWIVKTPQNCTVRIEFIALNAKVPGEILEIGSGNDTSTNHIWSLTGTQANIPRWFEIDSNVVWMWFRSNDHKNPTSHGFSAIIRPTCDQDINTPSYIDTRGSGVSLLSGVSYTIASPNSPQNHPPSLSRIWLIKLPQPACQLTIDFDKFTTRSVDAMLEISSSASLDTVRAVLYGDVIPEPITFTSDYVLIRFSSRTYYIPDITTGFKAHLYADCESGVSSATTTGQPSEGTAATQPTTVNATTPVSSRNSMVPSTPSAVVPIQQNVTNGTTGELLRRSYSITDRGMVQMFRGWVDVQGQGTPNDFCRVVRTDGKSFLSCLLAGSEEDDLLAYTSPNPSVEWFDPGYSNTWYMKDEDNDGRDDYCR